MPKTAPKKTASKNKEVKKNDIDLHVGNDTSFCAGTNGRSLLMDTIENAQKSLELSHTDPNPGAVRARIYKKFPDLMKTKTVDGFYKPLAK